MKRFAAVFVVLASTALSQAAHATPVDTLFQDFGLLGSWALHCKAPATPNNPHVSITAPQPGAVIEEHDLGPDYAVNSYRMLSAERIGPDELAVETIFQPGTTLEERQKLVFRVRDNTRRTIFNQPDNGPVRVKDGVVVGRDIRTPVLKKCD